MPVPGRPQAERTGSAAGAPPPLRALSTATRAASSSGVASPRTIRSTGRTVSCVDPQIDLISVRVGCVTTGPTPPGAGGAGMLARLRFKVLKASIQPMVATPGDPDRGIASDPKNGAYVRELGRVKLDIAYGGSCTAGKREDVDMYARVMADAERAGKRVADGVKFYIQFGSQEVEAYARERGYIDLFQRTGVEVIKPGCGACTVPRRGAVPPRCSAWT